MSNQNMEFISHVNYLIKNSPKDINIDENIKVKNQYEIIKLGIKKYLNINLNFDHKKYFNLIYENVNNLVPDSKFYLKYIIVLISMSVTLFGVYKLGNLMFYLPKIGSLYISVYEYISYLFNIERDKKKSIIKNVTKTSFIS